MSRRIAANLSIALSLVALSITATYPATAMAWSEESHMTTGAIAYDDLAVSDPAALSQLEQIILAHPHYLKLAAHDGDLKGAERTRVIFEWLARWPDDMNGTAFEHRNWHYELRVVRGWTWLWPQGKISELTYPSTAQMQFVLWLNESMHLAEKVAYKGTALKATPTASDAPVATSSEIRFVQELAKRRLATAGYRISDTIKMALRPVQSMSTTG